MTAYLIVRAEVAKADRRAFDRWYETEHLPEAKSLFRARSACRGWSEVTAGVHIALYEFADLDEAHNVLASDEIKQMIAEFDRIWQGRVKRTREVMEIAQSI